MNKPALLLLLPALLLGCKDKEQTKKTTPDTPKAEASKTETPTNTAKTDSTKSTSTEAVSKPGPVPKGYTRLPDLSAKPERTFKAMPAYSLQEGTNYAAVIDTTKGQIVAELYNDVPMTVNNFVFLARRHFYDGIVFHRVIDGFMAQTGDPKGNGTGGPGYQFPDEFRTKYTFNSDALLAMANSGPNTNGSQFFITLAPTEFLNGKHTIFGKVIQGKDVLAKLTRTAKSDPSKGEEPIKGAKSDKILDLYIVTKNR